jgi:Zinc-binding
MPESNAAAKKRQQKANRLAGIGDETGRLVRQKDPPKMAKCTICQLEMKITKTNTELGLHASGKHNSTIDECFPGAAEIAAELAAAVASKGGKGGSSGSDGGGGGLTKAQKKKKEADAMDALLGAGLAAGKKNGKK